MGKLILVTGGARSGKSTFAEATASKYGENVLYVATSIPFDDEMKERVKRHREQRPSGWDTVEAYRDLDVAIGSNLEGKNAILLDCITIMVSNIMFEKGNELAVDWNNLKQDAIQEIENNVKIEIEKYLSIAKKADIPFIAVTNEVGMGIVPENALARAFRDIAGRINQMIARVADEVYFCISGIPVRIK
jgi:adenosylcobinamide kinase/adenosylcobinamide-phosphate guanylyltransferase